MIVERWTRSPSTNVISQDDCALKAGKDLRSILGEPSVDCDCFVERPDIFHALHCELHRTCLSPPLNELSPIVAAVGKPVDRVDVEFSGLFVCKVYSSMA